MFKEGQPVVVLKIYNNRVDGEATYIGPSNNRDFKGQHKVYIDGMTINVELSRIVDAAEYYKRK